ncbi:hypothetical protein, partial [Stenotrophomonas maltophilia]|uniref:hypothetical protein n=1 Tax=Stenotrophomonas maltophilia TaxID=40324 RepID=UPI001953E087
AMDDSDKASTWRGGLSASQTAERASVGASFKVAAKCGPPEAKRKSYCRGQPENLSLGKDGSCSAGVT